MLLVFKMSIVLAIRNRRRQAELRQFVCLYVSLDQVIKLLLRIIDEVKVEGPQWELSIVIESSETLCCLLTTDFYETQLSLTINETLRLLVQRHFCDF